MLGLQVMPAFLCCTLPLDARPAPRQGTGQNAAGRRAAPREQFSSGPCVLTCTVMVISLFLDTSASLITRWLVLNEWVTEPGATSTADVTCRHSSKDHNRCSELILNIGDVASLENLTQAGLACRAPCSLKRGCSNDRICQQAVLADAMCHMDV